MAKNLTISIVPVIVDNLLVCLTTHDLSIHSYFSDHSLQDKLIVLWMKIASKEVSLYTHLSVVSSAGLVACVVTPTDQQGWPHVFTCYGSSLTGNLLSVVWLAGLATCVCVLWLLPDRRLSAVWPAGLAACVHVLQLLPDRQPAERSFDTYVRVFRLLPDR